MGRPDDVVRISTISMGGPRRQALRDFHKPVYLGDQSSKNGNMTAIDRPEVSVVVVAYNQGRWLRRCIESVLRQTLDAIEIVVVDDCSCDDTADVIEAIAKEEVRVVPRRTAANAGPAAARHLGFEAARADFVATLDADDVYLSPRKLEQELDLARSHGRPDRPAIGYSRYVVLDADLVPLPARLQPREPLLSGDMLAPMFGRSAHIPRDFVMPKALYLEVGGYDASLPLYEDWDLKLRLAARADFHPTDLDGTGYVQHGEGLSRTLPSEHEAWLGRIFRKNAHLLDEMQRPEAEAELAAFARERGWTLRLRDAQALSERERLGEGLAFLISMPRAGSTLTQRMLTAHPDIHSRSESWLMLPPLLARETDRLWAAHNQELAAQALDDFVDHLPGGETAYRDGIRTCYVGLYREAADAAGARYHLDKTPRYHLIWEQLMTLFPRAKFILLWRHPLAVLHSMHETMGHDDRRMDFWRVDLQEGMDNLLALGASGRALEITYEDLIAEPEAILRRITDHLGLPFEPAMLDLSRRPDVGEAKYGDHKQAHTAGALDPAGLDRWCLSVEERPGFAALADAYLRANQEALERSPYDLAAMRRAVPRIDDPKADALVRKGGGVRRPGLLRSRAEIERADRWQKRLARIGPLPYELGRLAWRTYRNFRR